MNEYNVSDYKVFDNARATISSIENDIKTSQSEVNEVKKVLSDNSIFMGEVAKNCVESFSNANQGFESIYKNFLNMSRYLVNVSNTYQVADKNAEKTVTGDGQIRV